MANNKMHLIKYGPDYKFKTDSWQTECGEYVWISWRGTTYREQVTCKRCLKSIKNRMAKGNN